MVSVTALLAVLLESDVAAALTVIVFGVGGNSGAVYTPAAEIVPVVAFPPATPFTDQLTATAEPFIRAVKLWLAVPRTVMLEGDTTS